MQLITLPPPVLEHVLSYIPPQDIACVCNTLTSSNIDARIAQLQHVLADKKVQRLLAQLNIKIGTINRDTVRTVHARLRAIVQEILPHIPPGTALPQELWQIVENPKSMRTVLSQYYDITCFKNTFFDASTLRMAGCTEAETDREKMEKIQAILPTLTKLDLHRARGPFVWKELSKLPSLQEITIDRALYKPYLEELSDLHKKAPNLKIEVFDHNLVDVRERKLLKHSWLPGPSKSSFVRNMLPEPLIPYNSTLNLAWLNLKEIPPEIFSQPGCVHMLILSNNKLRSLPAKIGEMQELRALCLSGNPLESLPPELLQLKALQYLYLDPWQEQRFGNELRLMNPNLHIFACRFTWAAYFSSISEWLMDSAVHLWARR